jgi:branched-chain amino acid transport system permease protein
VSLDQLFSIVISGVVLGSLYALMAAGLSLVWGTLRIFNFAHGAVLALGAYLAWGIATAIGGKEGIIVALALAVPAASLVGVGAERILVRPVLRRPNSDLIAMITTLAAATLINNVIHLIWGPRLKRIPVLFEGTVMLGPAAISLQDLFIIVLSPTILVGLALFLKQSRTGTAVRAVTQNSDQAHLVGIDVPRIYAFTFGLASGLAALAGVFLAGIFFMTPTMGNDPLLRAFIVVVFGGLASLGGTIVAAYLIGLVEAVSVFFLGLFVTPIVLFGMMIAVLLLRPRGLFGRAD